MERTITYLYRLFHFPILTQLSGYLIAILVYTTVVSIIEQHTFPIPSTPGDAILSGLIFGLLMNFRTTSAYDRWWEGRKLWGQLVNETRNLWLKTIAIVGTEDGDVRRFARLLAAFPLTLKQKLRGQRPAQLEGLGPLPDNTPHVPAYVSGEIFKQLNHWYAEGKIDGFQLLEFDRHARELMNICGACERILLTPLVQSYRSLLRKGIALYLILMPWLLLDELGYLTIPVVFIFAYPVMGLELIASEIEEPFGFGGDDLPLDSIAESLDQFVTVVPADEAASEKFRV